MAADGTKELDTNMTTQDMPQQMESAKTTENEPVVKHKKHMHHRHGSTMHKHSMDKSMDKPINMDKSMDNSMDTNVKGDSSNSMNMEPTGTPTDNSAANPKDVTNSKKY